MGALNGLGASTLAQRASGPEWTGGIVEGQRASVGEACPPGPWIIIDITFYAVHASQASLL